MQNLEDGEIMKSRNLTPEWDQESSKKRKNKSKKKEKKKKKSRSRSKDKKKYISNKSRHEKISKKKQEKYKQESRGQKQESYQKTKLLTEKEQAQFHLEQEVKIIAQNNEFIEQKKQQDDIDDEINYQEIHMSDDDDQIIKRRQAREQLFQKYQEENIQQEPNEEEDDPQPQQSTQIIDENRQKYFKILDMQRNKPDKPLQQKIVIDMFNDEEDIEEQRVIDEQQTEHYEFDDESKYYRITAGEQIQDYKIINICGRGVFGNVCKALNKEESEFAIKFIRSEEIYLRSGEREKNILKQLNDDDTQNKKHILRLIEYFEHKRHLCLVFESMDLNLREALKVYTKNQGLDLDSIRSYAMQLFVALSHLKKHKIIHADIKPDNILISKDTKSLKLCDFGTAFNVDEATVVEYLVSRFYRAPEIIIGYPYDTSIDIWATGCTLFELFTGQFLFPGESNNEMLKLHIQTIGKLSMKMLRRSALSSKYFDQQLNFLVKEQDPITKQVIAKPILLGDKPARNLTKLLKPKESTNSDEQKKLFQFKDLLEKCLQLDPKNRINPQDALFHPFITQNYIQKKI